MGTTMPRVGMPAGLPAVLRAVLAALRVAWWALVGACLIAGLLVWLVARGLARLAQVFGFVAGPVDELVTAWLGIAAVLPRLRRWRARWGRQVAEEWRAYRAGAIEGEVMDGVWR